MPELNAKQKRFVEEYLKDSNATQAAIRAGYSERTAHSQGPRLLGNVGVAEAIAVGQQRLSEKAETDAEWIRRRLKIESEREGEGATHNARVSALDKLAKIEGLYVEKHEVEHRGGFIVRTYTPKNAPDA